MRKGGGFTLHLIHVAVDEGYNCKTAEDDVKEQKFVVRQQLLSPATTIQK